MPRKKVTAFSGGWSASKANEVKSVTLPDKIQCFRCQKFKPQDSFSKVQLTELRHQKIKWGASATPEIKCRNCTGGQVTELECFYCSKWKGLDEFAKAQRNKPDKAKCLLCMKEQLEMEPEDSDPESSSDESYGQIDDAEEDYRTANSEAKNIRMNQLSLDDAGSASENTRLSLSVTGKTGSTTGYTYTSDGYLEQPLGKRVIVPPSRASGAATPNGWETVSAAKPFNPNAYRSAKAPASVAGSTTTYGVGVITKGGWAKPPRGQAPKKDEEDEEEEEKDKNDGGDSNWPSDDEDDEDYGKL